MPLLPPPRLSRQLLPALGLALALLLAPGRARADGAYPLTAADQALLEEIQHAGFRYFAEQAHPVTGLVRDRARADGSPSAGKASIAASGFALGAWVIGTERGWTTRTEAVDHVRRMLRFLATTAPRRHGFFYHFMEMDTGARAWNCELSSIDSALFYAGAILAREYFQDPAITADVNRLLADVDWPWFLNEGSLVALGWHDEWGFSRYRWNNYSEHVLMSFLALGVSPRALGPDYWDRWFRLPIGRYAGYTYLQEPPLFVHQFPQAFVDLRGRRDAHADYFLNTRLATLAQRRFCADLAGEFPAWSETLWGVTASDSATDYKAWGGPPRTLRHNALDGTLVPCAAAGSLPFAPAETLAVLHRLRGEFGAKVWQRYGFADAFNPQTGWVASDVIGIDLGVTLLQAENLRSGLVWRLFMQAPELKVAMEKAGFLQTGRNLEPAQQAHLQEQAAAAWAVLQTRPAEPGLHLAALIAAGRLGLVPATALPPRAESLLAALGTPPADAAARARLAAALITLRQAVPALAAKASALLEQIPDAGAPAHTSLGDATRLGVFLQIARGRLDAAAWNGLDRGTTVLGPVRVLAPVDTAGALLPGLWLDESGILSGAAASQLAYASLTGHHAPAADAFLPALQLAQFPREFLGRPAAAPAPEGAAALLIAAANLQPDGGVRALFQQDPLVQAGRTAIAEFGEDAFGPNTSVVAQRELSMMPPPPAVRLARAVPADRPQAEWDWQTVAGPEFRDINADVRPGDAPLEFRFAFTWDRDALHFHAVVADTPAGFKVPEIRTRGIELFLDPDRDGLVWSGPGDYQFSYRLGSDPQEMFQGVPTMARFTPTADGYVLEATIPWRALGLSPQAGRELAVSPAALAQGTREWESTMKLNWSYAPADDGSYRLGRIRLE